MLDHPARKACDEIAMSAFRPAAVRALSLNLAVELARSLAKPRRERGIPDFPSQEKEFADDHWVSFAPDVAHTFFHFIPRTVGKALGRIRGLP